jgi:hypothetical protein
MNNSGVISSVFLFSAWCVAQHAVAQDATRPPGWVVIPITEYQTLRGRAYPAAREAEPSIEATLSKVEYDLRIEGPLASGRAALTVDVLKDGWVRVPIPQGLLVRESRMDGHSVALVPAGRSGQLSAVFSHRGRSTLTLDLAFPIPSAGGEERLSLPASSSGVTRASINPAGALSGQDFDVKLSGGMFSEKTAARWLAYARGNEPLVFSWRRKIEEKRAELPLRFQGSITQIFGLGEDSTTVSAEVRIDVKQGAVRELRITVPPAVTINQVPGATVADWDVKNGELIVNLLEPVEQSASFAIQGESRLPREGAIGIPLLQLLDAERVSGGVAVEVLGAGEIKDARQQGLEPTEPGDLGTTVASRQSPSMVAFRERPGNATRSLDLQVARYTQQAVLTANIEEARYRILAAGDGKILVQARLAVRNNQRSFLKVTLPAGASVWSSSVAGRAVRAGQSPDGGLLFPLPKNRAGEDAPVFAVEILYLARGPAWESKGKAALTLPGLDLPVSRTGVSLYYPPSYRVTPAVGAFRAQPFEPSASLALNSAAAPVPDASGSNANIAPSTQALLDNFRARTNARRASEAVPVGVAFPAIGPMLFLVSELTGENKAAVINLDYQEDKKAGLQ